MFVNIRLQIIMMITVLCLSICFCEDRPSFEKWEGGWRTKSIQLNDCKQNDRINYATCDMSGRYLAISVRGTIKIFDLKDTKESKLVYSSGDDYIITKICAFENGFIATGFVKDKYDNKKDFKYNDRIAGITIYFDAINNISHLLFEQRILDVLADNTNENICLVDKGLYDTYKQSGKWNDVTLPFEIYNYKKGQIRSKMSVNIGGDPLIDPYYHSLIKWTTKDDILFIGTRIGKILSSGKYIDSPLPILFSLNIDNVLNPLTDTDDERLDPETMFPVELRNNKVGCIIVNKNGNNQIGICNYINGIEYKMPLNKRPSGRILTITRDGCGLIYEDRTDKKYSMIKIWNIISNKIYTICECPRVDQSCRWVNEKQLLLIASEETDEMISCYPIILNIEMDI